MDKELDELIGFEKLGLSHHDYALKVNKLERVTEMTINLDELDNTDNLEDGRPSNALFMYYVSSYRILCVLSPTPHSIKNLKMIRLFL